MYIPGLSSGLLDIDIIVRDRELTSAAVPTYPSIVLIKDNWNDFGFQTSFNSTLYLSRTDFIDLGPVKILQYAYPTRPFATRLPPRLKALDAGFCSLGSTLDYYEKLNDIDRATRDLYLRCMNDVVFDNVIKKRFQTRPGFEESLLRSPDSVAALEHATFLMAREEEIRQDVRLTYVTPDGASLKLRFNSASPLPNRINAIIGYNGVGKTTVLAGIAQVAASTLYRRGETGVAELYGRFEGSTQRFATTIAVSYSAFDSFEVPDVEDQDEPDGPTVKDEGEGIQEDGKVGYSYCGLRRHGEGMEPNELKSKAERLEELEEALSLISTNARKDALDEALKPLLNEPSFRRSGSEFSFQEESWQTTFNELSSGHQIALAIIVQLIAHMKIGSLALIDEPESHLHPPLVAALMKGIGVALERTSSFAILATHSPVVIQEVPKSCVHVLRRIGQIRRFDKPSRETYGENLGILTSEVFNLDNTDSSYEGVLRLLARTMSGEKIEGLFEDGLSGQARAILMQEGVEF